MATKQCKGCPFRVGSKLSDIPGYSREKHEALSATFADPAADTESIARALSDYLSSKPMHVMACHHSKPGRDVPCAGWLAHQLGDGNNVVLRLAARNDERLHPITVGPQRKSFEATLAEDDTEQGR